MTTGTSMRRWFVVLGVGTLTLAILALVRPDLILVANTPTGGDMGAHVLGPAALRDTLLPSGRIIGWSNDWFAGFPLFYFYFPLPALVIVALDLVMPYGVAFKIVTVLGLLATPAGAVYLARSLGFDRVAGLVAGVFGAAIVLTESYTIYGGNIPSTMAGEFTYSWSFALGLFALGATVRAVDAPRLRPLAALLLALTALSHVLTTVMVVLAMIPIMTRRGGASTTVLTWVWGFALSAFWALPLLVRIGLTADMGWRPLTAWEEIFPTELWMVLPFAILGVVLSARRRLFTSPILVMGVVPVVYFWLTTSLPRWFPDLIGTGSWKLWNGRLIPYWYFAVLFFAGAGLGLGWQWVTERLPWRLPTWVPFSGAALLAWGFVAVSAIGGRNHGVTIGSWQPWSGLTVPGFRLEPITLALLLTAVALVVGLRAGYTQPVAETGSFVLAMVVSVAWVASVSFATGWATWNFVGYEGKETWPEYEAVLRTVAELEPGRVQWEHNANLQRFGTPMALMLLPYWTEGTHHSQEGLFFESSLTTPFHFVNQSEMSFRPSSPIPGLPYRTFDMERGLRHLEAYAVDYYISVTPEAREKADEIGMERIAESGEFVVYDLRPQQLVEVSSFVPSVYVPPRSELLGQFVPLVEDSDRIRRSFSSFALEWYTDLENLAYPVTTEGPEEWPRITELDQVREAGPVATGGVVSEVELDDHRISFRTTAVGVPHVVKVSYFANWQATGADGPYRSTPSLMVVVPTEESVVLEFRNTWVEWLGIGLSVVGLVYLLGMALRPKDDATR